MRIPKRRILSLAGGTLWLVVAGSAFAVLSLVFVGKPVTRVLLPGVIVLAVALVAVAVLAIRAASRLPGKLPPLTPEERAIMRRVVQVTVAEVVVIAAVNWLCAIYRQFTLMVPLDLIVVGLHFLPLASILQVSRYYIMGSLFCLVSIATLAFVPRAAQVGRAPGWIVVPGLICPVVVWLIAAANLRQVFQMVRGQQQLGG